MTLDDWQHARILAIAQMAATLEAGDRAAVDSTSESGAAHQPWVRTKPDPYVARAEELLACAEKRANE